MRGAVISAAVLVFAFGARAQEKVKANCVAEQQNYVEESDCKLEHKGKTVISKDCKHKEVEDWEVSCKVTRADKVLWEHKLPLAHPATRREALGAVDSFFADKFPKLVKELAEPKKMSYGSPPFETPRARTLADSDDWPSRYGPRRPRGRPPAKDADDDEEYARAHRLADKVREHAETD